MNQRSTSTPSAPELSPVHHAAQVTALLVACFALVALPAFAFAGLPGLAAAGIAALVCALASSAAAVVASRLEAVGQPIGAALLATMLRMSLPLAFCIVVMLRPGPLAEAGLPLYLIGFYIVALAADTWLWVGRLQSSQTSSRES